MIEHPWTLTVMDLVERGFSVQDVYGMTIRQVMLFQKVGRQYENFKRLSQISDNRVAAGLVEQHDAHKHLNQLRYG